MELSVRLVTRPLPGACTKILVVIVVVITVLVLWRAGYDLTTAIRLVVVAGLAGTQVARGLLGSQPERENQLPGRRG